MLSDLERIFNERSVARSLRQLSYLSHHNRVLISPVLPSRITELVRTHHALFLLHFYYATRMHSADYAVARCPSVRLSHAGIESKRLHISSKFFHHRVAHHSSFFPHQTGWRYSDGDPLTGAPNTRGCEKSRFSTNISLYLENDA